MVAMLGLETWQLEAMGQLFNAAAYRPLVVAWRNGSPGCAKHRGERGGLISAGLP